MEVRTFHAIPGKNISLELTPPHSHPLGMVVGSITSLWWSEHFMLFPTKIFFKFTCSPGMGVVVRSINLLCRSDYCIQLLARKLYLELQNISCYFYQKKCFFKIYSLTPSQGVVVGSMTLLWRSEHFMLFLVKYFLRTDPTTFPYPWYGGWKHNITMVIRTLSCYSQQKYVTTLHTHLHGGGAWKHEITGEIWIFHTPQSWGSSLKHDSTVQIRTYHTIPSKEMFSKRGFRGIFMWPSWSPFSRSVYFTHGGYAPPHTSLLQKSLPAAFRKAPFLKGLHTTPIQGPFQIGLHTTPTKEEFAGNPLGYVEPSHEPLFREVWIQPLGSWTQSNGIPLAVGFPHNPLHVACMLHFEGFAYSPLEDACILMQPLFERGIQ